jgi:ribosomal protein S18 acetylase RimI-like enzyme
MKIRKVKKEDIKQCVKLSKIPEFEIGNLYPDKESLIEMMKHKLFLVAEENKKIIGFIGGYRHSKKDAYIDLLTVSKKGKGIGKKLLEELKKLMKKQKIKLFWLIAPEFNKKTLNFYRKNKLKQGKNYKVFYKKL